MSLSALESAIDAAFDNRDGVSVSTKGEIREAVDHALELLDSGRGARRRARRRRRVDDASMAEEGRAALVPRSTPMSAFAGGHGDASWWDKVPSKFEGWGENRVRECRLPRRARRDRAPRRASSPRTSC